MKIQVGGGFIRKGKKYLWHNWLYPELECYVFPGEWLDNTAHLLPGLAYMSMN